MSYIEMLLIAVGLSMDAFAIAICKGLSMKNGIVLKQTVLIALFFGGFQALMPLIGYLLGSQFESYIKTYDHWVAFVLLAFIGGKMLYECLFKKEDDIASDDFSIKELFLLAVATSIDALAVGISFAVLSDVNVWLSVTLIGAVTFLLSAAGVVLGNKFGSRYKKRAEIAGGVILILMGLKILLEHLEIISF